MLLAFKYQSKNIQNLEPYIEAIFLGLIWLIYFLSINVNWTESWIAESFLPESVAPHTAFAFPIIFFVNVYWLIPKFFNRRKWYLYLIISLLLLVSFEIIRALTFSLYLFEGISFIYEFKSELLGENSLVFGKLNFITTNAIFWSFIFKFTRDWIVNDSIINRLENENTQLKNNLKAKKIDKEYRDTFTIKKRHNKLLLKVDAIVYFKAQGDFVFAFDFMGKKHIINDSLKNLNIQIDKKLFFQINRGEIINRNYIERYNPYIKNRVEIVLKDCNDLLYTSNSRTPKFRNWVSNNH